MRTTTRTLLAIGAAVLAMMMFLTAADVMMRYIFNRPIAGAFELAEYMMAVFIPLSIAYCAEQKGHVSVELITQKFPPAVKRRFDIVSSLITLIFAVFMTWQNVLYIRETYHEKLTSSVLSIPVFPFVAPVAIGIGAYALITLRQTFKSVSEVKIR